MLSILQIGHNASYELGNTYFTWVELVRIILIGTFGNLQSESIFVKGKYFSMQLSHYKIPLSQVHYIFQWSAIVQ